MLKRIAERNRKQQKYTSMTMIVDETKPNKTYMYTHHQFDSHTPPPCRWEVGGMTYLPEEHSDHCKTEKTCRRCMKSVRRM